jgi:SAM-dependent methyltransferase
MNAAHIPTVSNEIDVLASLVPLQERAAQRQPVQVIELGCGSAHLARELLELKLASSVFGLETDEIQHAKNMATPHPGLNFVLGSAAQVPFQDRSFDVALMLKSLHHVPMHQMGKALDEAARVLRPGGWLYVSEPVYEGALNDIVKLYNDEGTVRFAAQMALDESMDRYDSPWSSQKEERFNMPVRFADWPEFERRMLYPSFANHAITPELSARVKAAFEPHCGAKGAHFIRPMLARVLQKRA